MTGAKHELEAAAAVDAKRGASLRRESSGGGAGDERQSEADEARSPRSPRSPQTNDELQSSSLRSSRSSHDSDAVYETDDEDLRADPLPQRVPAIVKRTTAWGVTPVTPGVVTPRGPAVTGSPSASPDMSDFAASAKAVRGGCAPCARGEL